MKIEIQPFDDIEWASHITRINMLPYYLIRGIEWEQDRYEQTWSEYENFSVSYEGQRVGIIRLSTDDRAMYLRDLQVAARYHNLGIGTECLRYVIEKAHQQKLSSLRLSAFSENPAIFLYEAFGFEKVKEVNGLIKMDCRLS